MCIYIYIYAKTPSQYQGFCFIWLYIYIYIYICIYIYVYIYIYIYAPSNPSPPPPHLRGTTPQTIRFQRGHAPRAHRPLAGALGQSAQVQGPNPRRFCEEKGRGGGGKGKQNLNQGNPHMKVPTPFSKSTRSRHPSDCHIWVWLKIHTGGANRGFWSMFPLTRVPFGYRFFEPQPYRPLVDHEKGPNFDNPSPPPPANKHKQAQRMH